MEESMFFDKNQIATLLVEYYKRYEGMDVTANICVGKSITGKKYIPTSGTLLFDVRKKTYYDEGEFYAPLPIDEEDVKGILRKMIEHDGYSVSNISMEVDADDPTVFIGYTILATKNRGR